ncbi:MAG: dockerin type I domain-containing protein [Phycisphaerales bacterium JB039]
MQEPFDQFEDAQFVITTVNPTPPSLEQTHIRLGAIYYNSSISDWDYNFADIDLPGTSYNYYNSNIGDPPATPDSGGWGPATSRHYFESAVLMWPDSNTPLIFATHHIKASDSTSGSNPHIVQWYVINPDLANFDGTWSPSIMTNGIGRIPSSGDSDAYFPVIGVTAQGDAYLEYTLSDDETYPEIRRAAFNSSYTGISSDNQVQPGPDLAYDEPDPAAWADYSDMQADPISCGLWSMHVLVFDPEDSSTLTDARDVWVFENQITCTNAEMNGDGLVDETDLYLFNQYHLAGSRQADMNRDQTLDAIDVALYYDEYAKRSK